MFKRKFHDNYSHIGLQTTTKNRFLRILDTLHSINYNIFIKHIKNIFKLIQLFVYMCDGQ